MEVSNPHDAKPIVDLVSLAELLPHGAGIDGDYFCDVFKNGNLKVSSSYHKMNDVGYYDGWVPFSFRIVKAKHDVMIASWPDTFTLEHRKGDIVLLDVTCKDVGLREYLDELIDDCLKGCVSYRVGITVDKNGNKI
jgi:hypothetical protein